MYTYKLRNKQIHKEKKFQKILYNFIETYFLTNENPYNVSSFVLAKHMLEKILSRS